MSKVKAMIPNLLTAGNLLGGVLAIIFALTGKLHWAPYCIFISAFLDFFDGFAARLLKVQSELGKQLDSLADMVTFGVAPGVIVLVLFKIAFLTEFCPLYPDYNAHGFAPLPADSLEQTCLNFPDQVQAINENVYSTTLSQYHYCGPPLKNVQPFYDYLPLVALIIPVMSMFRLAKFNLDMRQTDSFIGVPTPANTLFFASLPLILMQFSGSEAAWKVMISDLILNPWFLIISPIVMSLLLVAELPLFALKFKSFGWKGNEIRFIFLTLAVVLLATLHWLAIPLLIILYILLSVVQNILLRQKAKKN